MPSSQQWNSEGSKTSISKPFPLKIGNTTTIYTVKTETNITNGQVGASKLTLQDSVTARSGKTDRALAISTDGGKTWSPTKDADGNNILTQDQLKSLQSGGSLNNAARNTSQIDAKSNGASQQQINQLSNGNAASSNLPKPEADPEAGVSTEQINEGLEGFKLKELQNTVADGGYRTSYAGGVRSGNYYIYPIDMSDKQDRIKFTMYRYVPKKIDTANISGRTESIFSGSNQSTKLGQVILPIQPTISDSNLVQWGEDRLNSLEAIAATAAYGAIQGGASALEESLEGVRDLIAGNNSSMKAALAAAMTGSAINKDFLTRATGGIINPNLELLFQGPALRSFQFSFDMSAREPKEAEEIRRIIRFFKQGMSVKRAASYLFLKSPNIFEIKYENGANKDHPWINRIKTCALQNCSVNYTPAGNYTTYEDGAMTQYNMTLSFNEIDPIYDDDYEGGKEQTTEIGY